MPYDLAVEDADGVKKVNTENIPIEARGGKGKGLKPFKKGHAIVRVTKHEQL